MSTSSGILMASSSDHEMSTHPTQDSECIRAIDAPVHTHKSRRPRETRKTSRSHSRSTPSRARSRDSSKGKSSKPRKATKRKRSRGRSRITSTPVKSKRSKQISVPRNYAARQNKCKPTKASIHRPRALGRKKSALLSRKPKPKLRSAKPKKLVTKKARVFQKPKSTKKAKRSHKSSKQPGGSASRRSYACPFQPLTLKRSGQKRKQPTRSKASRNKKARTRSRSRTPARSPPTSKKLINRLMRAVTARVRQRRPTPSHMRSFGGSDQCKLKPRPVSSIWKLRLRPRPLKSARFTCYRPSCMEQTPRSTKTLSLVKATDRKAKLNRTETKKNGKKQSKPRATKRSTNRAVFSCVNKNGNNACRSDDEDGECVEEWHDATAFHESSRIRPEHIACTVSHTANQPFDQQTIHTGHLLMQQSYLQSDSGISTSETLQGL